MFSELIFVDVVVIVLDWIVWVVRVLFILILERFLLVVVSVFEIFRFWLMLIDLRVVDLVMVKDVVLIVLFDCRDVVVMFLEVVKLLIDMFFVMFILFFILIDFVCSKLVKLVFVLDILLLIERLFVIVNDVMLVIVFFLSFNGVVIVDRFLFFGVCLFDLWRYGWMFVLRFIKLMIKILLWWILIWLVIVFDMDGLLIG